jgi:hypothetical protein
LPDYPRRPTLPGPLGASEANALWRARDEDRANVEKRFDRVEGSLEQLHEDVGEVKTVVTSIQMSEQAKEAAEQVRAASAEKRNQRIWQVASGVMVALLVALIIALFKVFAPIAMTGSQVKPERVVDKVDHIHGTIGE